MKGRSSHNMFLVVSDKRNRAEYFTEVIHKNFHNSSIFHVSKWFEVKAKLDNIRPRAVIFDDFNYDEFLLSVVSKILKSRYNEDIAIVIVSSKGHLEMFSEESAQGRVSFISQPYSEQALIQCLAKIVPAHFRKAEYELRQLQPGDILFEEGEQSEHTYIVKAGQLCAFSKDDEGARIFLGDIFPGEFIGEMGHFNHDVCSATVEAITNVELVSIPNGALESVVFTRPSWAKALVRTLAQRLRKVNKALAD